MASFLARISFPLSRGVKAPSQPSSRRALVARRLQVAASSDDDSTHTTNGTIFYGGKSYTTEEWEAAVSSGALARPATLTDTALETGRNSTFLSFAEVMSFSGTAPEIVNGRLAMLGFVSAVAAELASGEGVLRQWSEEPTGVALAFLLAIAGSLVTSFRSRRDDKLGPFTPQAELLNGRAAMIGFAALLVIEVVKGGPLI